MPDDSVKKRKQGKDQLTTMGTDYGLPQLYDEAQGSRRSLFDNLKIQYFAHELNRFERVCCLSLWLSVWPFHILLNKCFRIISVVGFPSLSVYLHTHTHTHTKQYLPRQHMDLEKRVQMLFQIELISKQAQIVVCDDWQ